MWLWEEFLLGAWERRLVGEETSVPSTLLSCWLSQTVLCQSWKTFWRRGSWHQFERLRVQDRRAGTEAEAHVRTREEPSGTGVCRWKRVAGCRGWLPGFDSWPLLLLLVPQPFLCSQLPSAPELPLAEWALPCPGDYTLWG